MLRSSNSLRLAAIALLGTLGVYLAIAVGFSARLSATSPSILTTGPLANSWALGGQAFGLVQAGNPADFKLADHLARTALEKDPTVIPAITTLALLDDMHGRKDAAQKLFQTSLRLSRRDLTTHLWFIEYFTSRGDARETMKHYDAALRTSAAAHPVLTPILLNAAFDPSLASPIVDRLVEKPSWGPRFISQLASSPGDTRSLVYLFRVLQQRGYSLDASDRATVLDRAVKEGLFREAFKLSGRSDSPTGLINSKFEAPANFLPFDWKLSASPENGAELVAAGSGPQERARTLRLYSDTGTGGEVASQLMLLKPGMYALKITAKSQTPEGDGPYASISCAGPEGTELSHLELTSNGGRDGISQASFAVADSAKCPAQWLRIFVRPSKSVNAPPVLVRSIFVAPVSSATTMLR